jgi:hypothetical protein
MRETLMPEMKLRPPKNHAFSSSFPAGTTRKWFLALPALVTIVFFATPGVEGGRKASPDRAQAAQQASPNRSETEPRGIKLMLKDGTFQRVREYKIEGDRVRYYSLDRSDWEEIPAALVDWTETKKEEAEENQADASLVKKAERQDAESRIMPMTVDASLEVAPGIFLPPGEGLWVFNNKAVLPIPPADPIYKTNRKRQIEKILSPVPIVSTRHAVLIQGAHSKLRIQTGEPEFYMRTTEDSAPDLELVAAEIERSDRKIARLDQLFKTETASSSHVLLMQRWQIAKGVYRYTLGQTLQPGEYALVEVIPGQSDLDQLSLYVWDFGVDAGSGETAKTK